MPKKNINEILENDSLLIFNGSLARFDMAFCDAMSLGHDFTLKLEIHGNKGELIHCRVHNDSFERPNGVEQRIQNKLKN